MQQTEEFNLRIKLRFGDIEIGQFIHKPNEIVRNSWKYFVHDALHATYFSEGFHYVIFIPFMPLHNKMYVHL